MNRSQNLKTISEITLLTSPRWSDYELLDSGDGQKLERFGPYSFIRPEVQALWKKSLPEGSWQAAHAVFQPSGEESGGHWAFRKKLPSQWELCYSLDLPAQFHLEKTHEKELHFSVMTTPGRHLGIFPECATHWDWMASMIEVASNPPPLVAENQGKSGRSINILNLFGYTGVSSLACAAAGARVTHVDASKKSISWARSNQELSGLVDKPIRWIVEDARKFIEREARRGVKYDGILLDPPKFGRGPKGEVWEIYKSLPELLQTCRKVISDQPLFVVLTVYAVKLPAVHAYAALAEMMKGYGGNLECGELVTVEKSAGRLLSQAVFARWKAG
jgi:23S rRNA (cytosine1962-C5)-methyltransferase